MSMHNSSYSGRDKSKGEIFVKKRNLNQSRYSINNRSEGEVGKDDTSYDTSMGEIKFPQISKDNTTSGVSADQSKLLAQTINYEEDKIPDDLVEKPIYESSEGPIPKQKNKLRQGNVPKTGKSGANILLSGESFGINPLRSMKGGIADSKAFEGRQQINENFLEEEEESVTSNMSESGEIDPKLFA